MDATIPFLVIYLFLAAACANPDADALHPGYRRALADTGATLFDSLSVIHRDRPGTGPLWRLHPPADSLRFIEGLKSGGHTGTFVLQHSGTMRGAPA